MKTTDDMHTSLRLQAVVELPFYTDEFLCPWPVSSFQSMSHMRVSYDITYPEIGAIVAQLARYNRIALDASKQDIIRKILHAKGLVLPGGIQVIGENGETISPSCCCGLETWREWFEFCHTGATPWLGHDPAPWLERQDDTICVWSDGGLEPSKHAFSINVDGVRFRKALSQVERDLQGFTLCLESWAQNMEIPESRLLAEKFALCFSIGKRHTEL